MKRLLRIDWDVVAGITAAIITIVLHLLGSNLSADPGAKTEGWRLSSR